MKILVFANCSWFFFVSFDNHVKLSSKPLQTCHSTKNQSFDFNLWAWTGQTRNLAMWFLSQINFTHTTPMVDPFLYSRNWILIGSLFINVIQSQRAEQKREIRVSKYQLTKADIPAFEYGNIKHPLYGNIRVRPKSSQMPE